MGSQTMKKFLLNMTDLDNQLRTALLSLIKQLFP